MQDDIKDPYAQPPSPPTSTPAPTEPELDSPLKFKTPDEVAAHDEDIKLDLSQEEPVNELAPKPPKAKRKFWPPSKKQMIISGVIILVLAIIGGGLYLAISHHKTTVATITTPKPKIAKPISDLIPSTLTGQLVAPSVNQRPITAVMIENLPPARPQSGLSQAGVVIEALTEGGITRFEAFFQNNLPTYVGPVRSVRPYFLDWALGFDAPIAHDGGSAQALAEIPSLGVKNLDYLDNPNYYTRISSRQPPHNLYTSLPNLIKLEASNNWTSSNFSGWPRKADAPVKNPNATNINFTLSYSTYNVAYSYDPSTNSYNRSEGGAPQIGANTNKQISPKVVIGMVVPWSQGSLDTSNAYYSVYQDVGSGQAYVFQDGTLTLGQWNKPSAQAPLSFTTASGQPLKLNAGQTWITVLASSSDINYN